MSSANLGHQRDRWLWFDRHLAVVIVVLCTWHRSIVTISKPKQNCHQIVTKCLVWHENRCILVQISSNFVSKCLVQLFQQWHRRETKTWTNVGLMYWCKYASLSLEEQHFLYPSTVAFFSNDVVYCIVFEVKNAHTICLYCQCVFRMVQGVRCNMPKIFRIVPCTMLHLSWKLHENIFACLSVMLLTDKEKGRQTDRHTYKRTIRYKKKYNIRRSAEEDIARVSYDIIRKGSGLMRAFSSMSNRHNISVFLKSRFKRVQFLQICTSVQ